MKNTKVFQFIWAPELNEINSVQKILEEDASLEQIRASIGIEIEVCITTSNVYRYRIVPLGIA